MTEVLLCVEKITFFLYSHYKNNVLVSFNRWKVYTKRQRWMHQLLPAALQEVRSKWLGNLLRDVGQRVSLAWLHCSASLLTRGKKISKQPHNALARCYKKNR